MAPAIITPICWFMLRPQILVGTMLLVDCLASYSRADQKEDEPLRAIQKAGAFITRDESAPGRPVVGVEFYYRTANNLKALKAFPHLKTLGLSGSFPSESDLRQLAGLKELQTLNLGQISLTRRELKSLATLKSIRRLDLRQTTFLLPRNSQPPVGKGRPVAKEKEDRSADVVGSGFIDLKELAALPKLESLKLGATHFQEGNLKELTSFKGLQELSLESN